MYRTASVVSIERTVDTNLLSEKMRTLLGKNDPAATAARIASFLTVGRAAKVAGLLDLRLSDADIRFNPAYSEVVEALRERVRTWPDAQGRIHIEVLDPDPKSAFFLANILARVYARIRTEELVSGTAEVAKSVDGQILLEEKLLEEDKAELSRLETESQGGQNSPLQAANEASLKDKVEHHQQALDQLQTTKRQVAFLSSGRLEQMRILQAASLPRRPANAPHALPGALLGLLAGLLASTALALALERRDRGPGLAQAVEDLLRLPILGFFPWCPALEEEEEIDLIEGEAQERGASESGPRSPLERLAREENLRQAGSRLRDRLDRLPAGPGAKIVGLAATEPGAGATAAGLHLALSLAEAGKSVLLIDAHPEADGLTSLLGLEDRPGLAEVLAGDCEGAEATLGYDELPAWPSQDPAADGPKTLSFLPAGISTSGPAGQPAEAWPRLLALARLGYDAVVVDLPDPHEDRAAGFFTGLDRLLLVQWLDGKPLARLAETMEKLGPGAMRSVGVVFNGYAGPVLPDLDPFRGVSLIGPGDEARLGAEKIPAGRSGRRAALAGVLILAAAILVGGLYLYDRELVPIKHWVSKPLPTRPTEPPAKEQAPAPAATPASPTPAPPPASETTAVETPAPAAAAPETQKPAPPPEEKAQTLPEIKVQVLRPRDTTAPSLAYTLKVAAFRSREEALKLAQSLGRAEIGAYVTWVRLPGKGEWFRVFLGAYASAKEAETALKRQTPGLKKQGFAPEVAHMPFALAPDPTRPLSPADAQRLAARGLTPYRLAPKRPILVGSFFTRSGAEELARLLERDGLKTALVAR
jgi:Mrp family chromosome partitioning ATPase